MAWVIALGSQKGGPGKSTVGRAVGVALAGVGWSVKIVDLDVGQRSSADWNARRLEGGITPTLSVEVFGSVAQGLRMADAFDLVVIDGRPAASKDIVDVAKACDLFVIPSALALDDLKPAVDLADQLTSKHGIPRGRIAFLLNHAGDSEVEIAEAHAYLASTGFHVFEHALPEQTAYRRAQDKGLAITETPYKGPRETAEKVVNEIIARLTAAAETPIK